MKFIKLDVDTELSVFPDSSLPYMVMIEGVKKDPGGLVLNAVSISGAVILTLLLPSCIFSKGISCVYVSWVGWVPVVRLNVRDLIGDRYEGTE